MLKKIFPIDAIRQTIKRFPLSALCAFFLFMLMVLAIHDFFDFDDEVPGRLMVLSVYGYFWFGLVRVVREGLGWSVMREMAVALGVFAALAGFVFLDSGYTLVWFLGLMIPALLLGIAVGPYIKRSDDASFWFYNRQVWQGMAISIIAGLIWGGGVSLTLVSVDYLFGVDFDHEIYGDVWSFSMLVFAPLYALSWVPERYEHSEADCHMPLPLSFVLNWVLGPLIAVYMLILYAYFAKIALIGELPRGHLTYMVSAFGGIGIFTYMAGWPLRASGGPFIKLVHKVFFPALLVPIGMQALAIYERINQYGMTEERYVIVLATLWLAVMALLYTFKKPPMKVLPGVLAIMLVVASFGPLSATNVSVFSQTARLEKILERTDILVEGKIKQTKGHVGFKERADISSVLDFLKERKREDVFMKWMDSALPEEGGFSKNAAEAMGIEYVSRYNRRRADNMGDIIALNGLLNHYDVINVEGFKLITGNNYVYLAGKPHSEHALWTFNNRDQTNVEARYQGGLLYVGLRDVGEVSFDVLDYARRLSRENTSPEKRDLVLEQSNGDLRVKLVFTNITITRGNVEDDLSYSINNFNFRALIDYQR